MKILEYPLHLPQNIILLRLLAWFNAYHTLAKNTQQEPRRRRRSVINRALVHTGAREVIWMSLFFKLARSSCWPSPANTCIIFLWACARARYIIIFYCSAHLTRRIYSTTTTTTAYNHDDDDDDDVDEWLHRVCIVARSTQYFGQQQQQFFSLIRTALLFERHILRAISKLRIFSFSLVFGGLLKVKF